MKNRKIEICIILLYIVFMLIGTQSSNYVFNLTDSKIAQMAILTSGQVVATIGVNKIIKKHYSWEEVGFGKINKKSMTWFIPYILIILIMATTLLVGIFNNFSKIDEMLWIMLVLNLIGTMYAGFSEEVIFRGVILNNLKKDSSLILAMLVSSVGFSILHITVVFSGFSLIESVYKVFYTSLLGFAFGALAIKINNLWPLVIFHVLWNYVIIASSLINMEVSRYSLFFNPINLILGIILWILIIIGEIKNKKLVVNE